MGSMLEYPVELMEIEVPIPVEPEEEDIVPVLLPEVPENPVLVVDDPVVELLVVPELDVV